MSFSEGKNYGNRKLVLGCRHKGTGLALTPYKTQDLMGRWELTICYICILAVVLIGLHMLTTTQNCMAKA